MIMVSRAENVALERAFRKIDRLGDHTVALVPSMFVLLILCGLDESAHELVMGAVGTNWRLMTLIYGVQSKMLPMHSVSSRKFWYNLERI